MNSGRPFRPKCSSTQSILVRAAIMVTAPHLDPFDRNPWLISGMCHERGGSQRFPNSWEHNIFPFSDNQLNEMSSERFFVVSALLATGMKFRRISALHITLTYWQILLPETSVEMQRVPRFLISKVTNIPSFSEERYWLTFQPATNRLWTSAFDS